MVHFADHDRRHPLPLIELYYFILYFLTIQLLPFVISFFTMCRISITILFAAVCAIFGCQMPETPFQKDLAFLQKYDSVVVLTRGNSMVVVSPKYQAKVFTSTPGDGASYGWINYPAFDAPPDPHMNAYGGENRIWLGPEGGPFSLFFPGGFVMDFANWKIPAAFDTEPWNLVSATDNMAVLEKDMLLTNYSGTSLQLSINRKIRILDNNAIAQMLGTTYGVNVNAVAYHTENNLTNTGKQAWNDSTGMPCIWVLDMFPPSPNTTVIIPIKKDSANAVNTNYFGKIPSSRIRYMDSVVLFKADGRKRSKLGVLPQAAKNIAGSYNADEKKLTITLFDISPDARYLNQEWDTKKPPFSGDAVNAYNDGPLEDGRQLGPFYEIESVSPAAFLQPRQTLSHNHSVFHFSGSEKDLETICMKTLGVSLAMVKKVFN